MSKECDHNCLKCKEKDCVNDVITKTEKYEANQRDFSFIGYGKVIHQKPSRAKYRHKR